MQAFEKEDKDIDYYALDLSHPELERTLSAVDGSYKHVRCHGLLGTYDDGLSWLKKTENINKPKCILWMGSSIGNLNREEAAGFLNSFSNVLQTGDSLLVGIDACQDKDRVFHAYNDKEGKTHEFVLNGLSHANKLVGKEVFNKSEWQVIGEYDTAAGRHQAFYSPMKDVYVENVLVKKGERIRVEESYKYSPLQSSELWQKAGLAPVARFGNLADDYREFCNTAQVHVTLPCNFRESSCQHCSSRAVPRLRTGSLCTTRFHVSLDHPPLPHMLFAIRNLCVKCYYPRLSTEHSVYRHTSSLPAYFKVLVPSEGPRVCC